MPLDALTLPDAVPESIKGKTPCAEDSRFESWLSQTNDLHMLCFLLPNLVLDITWIEQALVSSVLG